MHSNNILNFQESMTIFNACTEKFGNLLKGPRIYIYIYIYTEVNQEIKSDNIKKKYKIQNNPNLTNLL